MASIDILTQRPIYKTNEERLIDACQQIGWIDKSGNFTDERGKNLYNNMVDIIELITDQGHTGLSYSYLMQIIRAYFITDHQ